MNTYVVDREALLRRPDLCVRAKETDSKVVVHDYVIGRLDNYLLHSLGQLLLGAADAEYITISLVPFDGDVKRARKADLSLVQLAVLDTALHYQQLGDEVQVVTSSEALARACNGQSIKTISPAAAAKKLPAIQPKNAALELIPSAGLRLIQYYSERFLFQAIAVAGVIIGAANFEWLRLMILKFYQFSSTTAVTLCVFLGIVAFAIRSRFRLSYALLEIIVGVWLIVNAIGPTPSVPDAEKLVRIVGGVYVIVRGLDNVGKAIAGHRIGLLWWRVFGD